MLAPRKVQLAQGREESDAKEIREKRRKEDLGFKKPVVSLLQLYEVSKNDPEATLASNAENMVRAES
jgi:hypothetical protein